MELNIREIFTSFMVLFAVIDIIGNIPIIIDLRSKNKAIQSRKASLVAGIVMIVFMFVGEEMLNLIGIDVNSFAIAGAFVLFFIALEMILGVTIFRDNGSNDIKATVFPLAFPLIAGPGSLTTILSIKSEFSTENLVVAIVLNILVVYVVLKTSNRIKQLIGKNGINIIRKIFGVILLAVAVKLFAANISVLF